jgi:hypothetical protein
MRRPLVFVALHGGPTRGCAAFRPAGNICRDGRVRFRQAKNEHRNPIDIDIPLHPALAESIAAAKVSTNMTDFGKPFTANGFGDKFKDWCRRADLPHCLAHGIRKVAPTGA